MRLIIRIILILAGLVGIAFVVFYLTVIRPIERVFTPATPIDPRTDMLDGGANALILSPFVTGDVPRLVRGDALENWSRSFWYIDDSSLGSVFGSIVFAMAGVPPATDIGTAFQNGTPLATFACITKVCSTWENKTSRMWGMADLRGKAEQLGPQVEWKQTHFTDYPAYVEAHNMVVADPLLWFAKPRDVALQPDSDGLRDVFIALPTRLSAINPFEKNPEEQAAILADLTALSESLIEGTGGELNTITGVDKMPIWAAKDDRYLYDGDRGTRALPDLAMRNPVLRLRVGEDALSTIRSRLRLIPPAPVDQASIDQSLARAFAAWDIDDACLPECGGVFPAYEFNEKVEMNIGRPPFWSFAFWRIPQTSDGP